MNNREGYGTIMYSNGEHFAVTISFVMLNSNIELSFLKSKCKIRVFTKMTIVSARVNSNIRTIALTSATGMVTSLCVSSPRPILILHLLKSSPLTKKSNSTLGTTERIYSSTHSIHKIYFLIDCKALKRINSLRAIRIWRRF